MNSYARMIMKAYFCHRIKNKKVKHFISQLFISFFILLYLTILRKKSQNCWILIQKSNKNKIVK